MRQNQNLYINKNIRFYIVFEYLRFPSKPL